MSKSSRGTRVTITLGRSGQVVKRSIATASTTTKATSDNNNFHCSSNKRSVSDRLGPHFDPPYDPKRRRSDDSNHSQDVPLAKNDLRFKLLRKRASSSSRARSTGRGDNAGKAVVDLRHKLTKAAMRYPSPPPPPPPPHASLTTRPPPQRLPQTKDDGSMFTRVRSAASVDDLPQVDSFRGSYYSLERGRSPDRVVSTSSRGLSPPPRKVPHMPVHRMYDDVRSTSYLSNDVIGTSRSMSTTTTSMSFMTKPSLPSLPAKPLAAPPPPPPPPLGQLVPSSSNLQRTSLKSEEPQTVEGLLYSLGLGKYAILFKAEEVDIAALKQMGETDLKEMGIPMGPRKKLLLALQPHSKRHP